MAEEEQQSREVGTQQFTPLFSNAQSSAHRLQRVIMQLNKNEDRSDGKWPTDCDILISSFHSQAHQL